MSIITVLMAVATVYLILVNIRSVAALNFNEKMDGTYVWKPTGQHLSFRVYDPESGWVLLDGEEKTYKLTYEDFNKHVESGILKRVEE